ncbi:MAG TPA: SDR family NAD(P)-dependent oxidoreductase [Thermoplasmata archaeon]|nr:SDR family NAD(P)-dependent oxidoreductase [Thermoplasmata archaeon]
MADPGNRRRRRRGSRKDIGLEIAKQIVKQLEEARDVAGAAGRLAIRGQGPARTAGRVALVTGGSRRMGKAIALALAKEGADVHISYRSRASDAKRVSEAIEAQGRRSIAVRADLTRPADCRRLVETIAGEFGRLDILVNNVGAWARQSVEAMDLATWRRVLDSNLSATFLCSKYAFPHMRRNGWGRIINLGAAGAYRAHGSTNLSAFYAAKAGIVAFTKSLAREVGRFGITVNVVSPGVVEDPDLPLGKARARRDKDTAVGRPATGADVASAVVFLASEDASFITGDVIGVTGGWLL